MGAFRDLFVFAVVMLCLPYAVRRPFVGLLLFSWLAYMRPQDLCWGFARSMRFSFLVAAAMVIGFFAHEAGKRTFTRWDVRTIGMALLMLCVTTSLALATEQGRATMRYYFEFIKIILIALFTVGQVTDRARLRWLLWTICGSFAFYGFKGGLFGVMTGGSRILRGPGGMLEDNNDFALALVLVMPLLFYLGRAEGKVWLRRVCDAAMVLTAVTVFLTHSRGAALALIATLLVIAWRAGNLFKAVLGLALAAVVFFMFAPEHVLDRLATLKEGTEEGSAATRIRAWTVALRMIEANPVFGVGIRNFQEHWHEFSADLTKGGSFAYVAHNSYLQIWAEGGTVAFTIYMTLLGSMFVASRRVRRWARVRPDLAWAGNYARMMEATTVGFMVGSFFLNRGHFDLVYHYIAIMSCIVFVARDELHQATLPAQARAAPPAEVTARPALAGSPLGRW
jgi:probable O-glycosylation ligase (exosortase A-associated)